MKRMFRIGCLFFFKMLSAFEGSPHQSLSETRGIRDVFPEFWKLPFVVIIPGMTNPPQGNPTGGGGVKCRRPKRALRKILCGFPMKIPQLQ